MSLPTILLISAAVSIGAMVITIIIAFRSDREAKSAIFPIVREEEARRAQRSRIYIFIWAAVTALFLGGWLATLQTINSSQTPIADNSTSEAEIATFETEEAEPPISTETATLVEVDTAQPEPATPPPTDAPTLTPLTISETTTEQEIPTVDTPTATVPPPTETPLPPTATPVPPTATPEPTLTPTPEPTATPTPLSQAFRVPTTGPRTPAPPSARMGPIQFSAQITEDNQAINPADLFPQGIEKVYAVFPYSGMENGLDFKLIWYKDGVELWREENQWEWGDQARFFSFFNNPDAGLYKVELYVNDSVLASGLMEVR